MIPKKPAPHLMRGGHRFSEKIMLHQRGGIVSTPTPADKSFVRHAIAELGKSLRLVVPMLAILGVVVACLLWPKVQATKEKQERGVEAAATIAKVTPIRGLRGKYSYELLLQWRDKSGVTRSFDRMKLSEAFTWRLVQDGRAVRTTVRIKYLADKPDVGPDILDDTEKRVEEIFRFRVGLTMALGGALISALLFWPRRRKPEAAASQSLANT
jgi:hypothetical protein